MSQQSMLPFQASESTIGCMAHLREYCQTKCFQNKLQNFLSHPGDTSPPNLTTHSFKSGSAGVLNGIENPFQVP